MKSEINLGNIEESEMTETLWNFSDYNQVSWKKFDRVIYWNRSAKGSLLIYKLGEDLTKENDWIINLKAGKLVEKISSFILFRQEQAFMSYHCSRLQTWCSKIDKWRLWECRWISYSGRFQKEICAYGKSTEHGPARCHSWTTTTFDVEISQDYIIHGCCDTIPMLDVKSVVRIPQSRKLEPSIL